MSGDSPSIAGRHYIGLDEARQVLGELGIQLSERQMKRAAETDAHGRRKLPFFIDPIDGRLKIDKHTLISIYARRQTQAINNSQVFGPR